MSSLNSIYIKRETLKTMLNTLEMTGRDGIEVTVSINDEGNEYGKNVSCYISQTKEERADKKQKFYVGNGKTFWTDGVIKVSDKKSGIEDAVVVNEALPF